VFIVRDISLSAAIRVVVSLLIPMTYIDQGGKLTLATDFYTSPGDPYFFLHHAMIDRTWYIWQSQDFANRQQVIAGGTSMIGFNTKPQSLEDKIDLEVLNVDGKSFKIKELVSTVEGPFCYVYE
jgi:tyrosinase